MHQSIVTQQVPQQYASNCSSTKIREPISTRPKKRPKITSTIPPSSLSSTIFQKELDSATVTMLSQSGKAKSSTTMPITTTTESSMKNTDTDDESTSDDDILHENIPEETRIKAMEKANKIMGKLQNDKHRIAHPRSRDSWLMAAIKTIINSTDKIILPHKYRFENTREAAKHNTKLLKNSRYDFVRAMKKEVGTIMEPGSEFRSHTILAPLFAQHQHWPAMREIISKGVQYNLEDISEEERKTDLEYMLKRGNHKSASDPENEPTLIQNYKKEVLHGWMLPVTLECIPKIKGASVIPVGVAPQFTIDANGDRQVKRRTTHDASFANQHSSSINDRMDKALLTNCFYGHCLIRMLHAIHIMRFKKPQQRILLTKLDLDAAYRRLHMLAKMAIMTITVIKQIAYILLRLPFGVANGPNDFCLVSEPIMDLTNDILRDETWDPNMIHSPLQSMLHPVFNRYNDDIPFGTARQLFVYVPFHMAMADGYIDDIITAMIEENDWVDRGQNAAPLAVHTLFRPVDKTEQIPRDDPASIRKLEGEGTPDEKKTLLGWEVDTRRFRIYLPKDKAIQWRSDIKRILQHGAVNTKTLESTIGRLNHAAHVIPQARYFLNRLRDLLHRTAHKGPQHPNRACRNDLHLWLTILESVSTKGIDINNITFTSPTITTYSDACEHGLGGYNTEGMAWRYNLPQAMIGILSINLLEFLAAAITISLTLSQANNPHKVLAFTDSSSALGWLYSASFSSSQPIHDKVARWLATQLIDNDSALYSQHIKGTHNIISDSLSRDKHISNKQLTFAFHTLLPLQTPQDFKIQTLPDEIDSWLQSLIPLSTKTPELQKRLSTSKLGALTDGYDSCQTWALKMNGLKTMIEQQKHTYCARSQACADEISMAKQTNRFSKEGQLKPPSRMFVRPFGRLFGQTQL